MGYNPGAAIYSWFIPFVNFVRPYSIATEIWIGSDRSDEPAPGHAILSLWWAAWIISGILGTIMLRQVANPSDFDAAMNAQWWAIAVNSLRVIAAVIAMIAIKRITDRQMGALPAAQKLAEKPAPNSK